MVTWDGRKSSRYLRSTLVIATIAGCAGFVYLSLFPGKKQVSSFQSPNEVSSSPEMLTADECISVCDSKECVYQSKYLRNIMDPDANPCENFFQFACGKISEKYDLEKFSAYLQRYTDILSAELKVILDNLKADPRSASGKMKTVYDSCMKYSTSDLRAVPTVLDFLRVAGIRDWPNVPPHFRFVDPSLGRVVAHFASYQEYGFVEVPNWFSFSVMNNLTVSSCKSSYETHGTSTRKYFVYGILKYFNLDPESIAKIWEESEAIHDAVVRLKEESLRKEEEFEYSDIFLDCTQDTRNKYEEICEWLESLIDFTGTNEKFNKNFAKIQQSSVHFILNIFPVLRPFSDRSIANYLALNVFFNNLNELNFYFRLLRDRVTGNIDEPDLSRLKWKKCVKWIAKNMALAMGYEYLKEDFTVPAMQDVLNLTMESVHEAADLFNQWMRRGIGKNGDEGERTNFVARDLDLNINLNLLIEVLSDKRRINLYYEQFHPAGDNFFQSVLEYKRYSKNLEIRDVDTELDRRFTIGIFLSNAEIAVNDMGISLGLLMPPTYTKHLPRFLNLVALGHVIAHEVGHLFETMIKQIRSLGMLQGVNANFENKKKCLEDQYSQFWIETIGKNVNGSSQFSENYADTVAVAVIDKFVDKYESDNSSSLLPSFPFSLKQLMYINTAQIACEVSTKESDEHSYTDSHTALRFRLLGMMQNSKGFSEAFECREGSYMNPINKCLVL